MFAAVVFDLDGTLVDSEAAALGAGLEVFGRLGPEFDTGFFHSLVGVDDQTARQRITAALPPGTQFETVHGAWRHQIRARFLAEGVPLKPGARELLDQIRDAGLPMAIATSSLAESAAFKLQGAGLDSYFQHVVVRESVAVPKPAPDAYLLAARLLGVAPRECLAFEDSSLGARAAHAAGMHVVQIPDVAAPEGRIDWQIAPDLLTAAQRMGLFA